MLGLGVEQGMNQCKHDPGGDTCRALLFGLARANPSSSKHALLLRMAKVQGFSLLTKLLLSIPGCLWEEWLCKPGRCLVCTRISQACAAGLQGLVPGPH